MIPNVKFFMIAFLMMVLLGVCYPHGVEHKILNQGMGVEFKYDDGSPISFSEVKIFSPGEVEQPYQEGLSDKYGRFFFLPDQKGNWKVVINDGMGHGATVKVTVDREMKITDNGKTHFSKVSKIIIGIGYILGISGIIFYILGYRKQKR